MYNKKIQNSDTLLSSHRSLSMRQRTPRISIEIKIEPPQQQASSLQDHEPRLLKHAANSNSDHLTKRFSCCDYNKFSSSKKRPSVIGFGRSFDPTPIQNSKCNRLSLPNIKKQVKVESEECKSKSIELAKSSNQSSDLTSFKLSSPMSKTGQCAILKIYEDEMYTQLKLRNPKKNLPRISTAVYNSNSKQRSAMKLKNTECKSSQSSLFSSDSLEDCDEAKAEKDLDEAASLEYLVHVQIENAISILSELAEYKLNNQQCNFGSLNRNFLSVCDSSSQSLLMDEKFNFIAKRYEVWHAKWSRMFNKFF